MVFASHLEFIGSTDTGFARIYDAIFYEGYVGVSFFFVLSGFVLTHTYKGRLLNGTVTTREFWITRAARIYPLHLLTLLLAIPAVVITSTGGFFSELVKFFSNAFLLHAFIPDRSFYFSFNAPSWTLSDEQFFYLLFPALILLLSRSVGRKRWVLVILMMLPIVILLTSVQFHHAFFYINPVFRLADFILGILLYEFFVSKKADSLFRSRGAATLLEIGTLIVFIAFFMGHSNVPQGLRYSCYYWIPVALLILVFSHQKGLISRLLSAPLFETLGELSFGFYLFHHLVLRYLLALNPITLIDGYLLAVLAFVLTLLASWLSFHLVEQPCKKAIRHRFKIPKP